MRETDSRAPRGALDAILEPRAIAVEELDINPLRVSAGGAIALDARVLLRG